MKHCVKNKIVLDWVLVMESVMLNVTMMRVDMMKEIVINVLKMLVIVINQN